MGWSLLPEGLTHPSHSPIAEAAQAHWCSLRLCWPPRRCCGEGARSRQFCSDWTMGSWQRCCCCCCWCRGCWVSWRTAAARSRWATLRLRGRRRAALSRGIPLRPRPPRPLRSPLRSQHHCSRAHPRYTLTSPWLARTNSSSRQSQKS